jgi:transcriptional regulator NrdR family protein
MENEREMKCPHCNKESKGKVIESRRVNGQVWRQRLCGFCLKTFISTETTSVDLKFPWNDLTIKRKARLVKSSPKLSSVWGNYESE